MRRSIDFYGNYCMLHNPGPLEANPSYGERHEDDKNAVGVHCNLLEDIA